MKKWVRANQVPTVMNEDFYNKIFELTYPKVWKKLFEGMEHLPKDLKFATTYSDKA